MPSKEVCPRDRCADCGRRHWIERIVRRVCSDTKTRPHWLRAASCASASLRGGASSRQQTDPYSGYVTTCGSAHSHKRTMDVIYHLGSRGRRSHSNSLACSFNLGTAIQAGLPMPEKNGRAAHMIGTRFHASCRGWLHCYALPLRFPFWQTNELRA